MQHFSDVLKILEGGLTFNAQTVVNYARALIEKLKVAGEDQQARLIQAKLDGATATLATLDSTTTAAVPIDQESKLDLGDVEYIPVGTARAVLDDYVRREVDRFISFANAADELLSAGVGISPRMIIYGPPGVGKTQLARFIASELRLPLITARCDSLISSYLGSTAKNIRKLFDHAAERPCVLFLDEFDALAKARDDSQELGELKRVVVGLLQNIDSLPPHCAVLAATNHHQLLDAAVWRRFAYRIHMDLPHPALRQALLLSYLGPRCPEIGMEYAVEISEGLSGAAIRDACDDTIRESVLLKEARVSAERLLLRLAQINLASQQLTPTDDSIARLLLARNFPQRLASSVSSLSMRQIAKLATIHRHEGAAKNGNGNEAEPGSKSRGQAGLRRPAPANRAAKKTTRRRAKKTV